MTWSDWLLCSNDKANVSVVPSGSLLDRVSRPSRANLGTKKKDCRESSKCSIPPTISLYYQPDTSFASGEYMHAKKVCRR